MSRISYSEDEDYPGQFGLWQASERSLRGKQGQAELRILREALLAMPEKRLIEGALVDENGEVCAIGQYAKHKGADLSKFDPEDDTDKVGIELGMPELVARKIVEMNDLAFGIYYYDPNQPIGFQSMTPEKRYAKMLAWVESKLLPEVAA